MPAEIQRFKMTTLPFVVRFGLGSTEPMKRWARFTLDRNGDMYWTHAGDLRPDVDQTDTHTSVHATGEIRSSRYQGRHKVHSSGIHSIESSFEQIKRPCQVVSGQELLEPGYFYHGLVTLREKDTRQTSKSVFVACLDSKIVNSRLYFSLDLLPWTNNENIVEYEIKANLFLDLEDSRSHIFIFCRSAVSAVVAIKFTEGDSPVDIQKVHEADKHKHSLKRIFVEEKLVVSDSVKISSR